MLRELEARGGGKVQVRVNPTERFSQQAMRAEKRYDILPNASLCSNRYTLRKYDIFTGRGVHVGVGQSDPAVC